MPDPSRRSTRRPSLGSRPDDRRPGAGVVSVVTGIAVLVLIGAALVVLRDGDRTTPVVDEQLTATPLASATPATDGAVVEETPDAPTPDRTSTAAPTAPPTPPPTASPMPPPTASPMPPPTETVPPADDEEVGAEPDEGAAAAAADAITPSGAQSSRAVVADLDADGRDEVVVASLLGGRSHVAVARWSDEGSYEQVFSGEGGTAEAVVELRVENINDTTDSREILVRQTSGTDGESISLWGVRGGEVVPLTAVDGCWHGSNTYGIVGATVENQRITATCDGSPDPIISWPSDVYVWEQELEAFAYERTLQP